MAPPSTRSESTVSSGDEDTMTTSTSWDGMTVNALKSELKSRDLPVSGVKALLITRLKEYEGNQTEIALESKKSKYFASGAGGGGGKQQSSSAPAPLKGTAEFGMAADSPSPTKSPSRTKKGKRKSPPVTPDSKADVLQTPTKKTKKGKRKSPPVTPDSKADNLKTPPTKRRTKSPTKSTKSTSPSASPRKRIKIEPGSLDPPPNWERIYKLVEELRSDKSAPVDTDGGHELPEKHHGPIVHRFQILTALMLSSQTKDAVVGETMRSLQKHGLTVQNIHATDSETLNKLIGKVGFHNNKTKFIKQTAEILITQYDGDIPPTAEEMMTALPGVGPKMAYIVEQIAFGTTSGIGVDTHMHRLFNGLQWVDSKTPEQTRQQLEGWLPKEKWGEVNVLWVGFGQEVQQQKEKMLRKVLACSSPREGLALVNKFGLDGNKEARKFGLEDELITAMCE